MPRLRCANAPATATLFVQLSMRPQVIPGRLPILDLLLPFRPSAASVPSIRTYHIASARKAAQTISSCRAPNRRPWRVGTTHNTLPASPARLGPLTRAFSTSNPQRATHAIFNPQVDDEGKEMMLEITPRAADVCNPLFLPRATNTLTPTPPPSTAPLQDHDQRLEPPPCPPNPSRERRLPRLSVSHEARDPAPIGAVQDRPARCRGNGRGRGRFPRHCHRRGRHDIHICLRREPVAWRLDGAQDHLGLALAGTVEGKQGRLHHGTDWVAVQDRGQPLGNEQLWVWHKLRYQDMT